MTPARKKPAEPESPSEASDAIPPTDDDLYGDKPVEEPTEQFVVFRLAAEWYGVPILRVREVVCLDTITPLPGASAAIIGIANLRGNIVSVTDLRQVFGLESRPRAARNRLVVIDLEAAPTALLVDEVGGVVAVPRSHLEPPLATLEPSRGIYIEQTCRWGERLVAILRLDPLRELTSSPRPIAA